MKYKLGLVVFDDEHGLMQADDDIKEFRGLADDSLHLPVDIWATKDELIAMGATPIDDTPSFIGLCPSCKKKFNNIAGMDDVEADEEKPTEPYKCSSYYDNNNQLQDCTCGKCGKKIEESNIDFKSKTDWQAHFILLENKLNEAIRKINSQEEK